MALFAFTFTESNQIASSSLSILLMKLLCVSLEMKWNTRPKFKLENEYRDLTLVQYIFHALSNIMIAFMILVLRFIRSPEPNAQKVAFMLVL